MSPSTQVSRQPKLTCVTPFHTACRKLFREVWANGHKTMDLTLHNLFSTTLSTKEFIHALKASKFATEEVSALLKHAEPFFDGLKNYEKWEMPCPPWLAEVLRREFKQLANEIFNKMYEDQADVEKEWCVIEKDESQEENWKGDQEEDFVLV